MAKTVSFFYFQHIIIEVLEQSLQIKGHHRVQHTIPVHDSLKIGKGIEKKSFFFVGQCKFPHSGVSHVHSILRLMLVWVIFRA